ncbi:MAG: hypothetical protein LRY43_04875, partial [Gammaproteobacteria bacterium]|nr:hypothetical protein [Gammaproteobacteria bacterium]
MNKSGLFGLFIMMLSTSVFSADFSGTYHCHLNDHSDGPFDATLSLKLVKQASFPNLGYSSYDIQFSVQDIPYPYVGMAAARGNDLALYFEATGEKKDPDDRGIGIASVVVDQDDHGKQIMSI